MRAATIDPVAESEDAATYTVSVRNLCAFAAKAGDLDLRFTPAPTAQQGREGHLLVAQRRGPGYASEISLGATYRGLRVRGRADGYDADSQTLEEVKTFRGALEGMGQNHRALHWAQLKVYGWLMCRSRGLDSLQLQLVYLDIADQQEHLLCETHTADGLRAFFEALCERFLGWAGQETSHRRQRDAGLACLAFPAQHFRPGQRALAEAVYRACVQSRVLLAQAPTGIGKTLGTLFPALRAMPVRGTDKLVFLTAKTPGRQVALDALRRLCAPTPGGRALPLRVIELVARSKSCEHPDRACHGQSCPLARGFYDRLPAARAAATARAWLDRAALRELGLAHGVCPYYLGQEMLRWSDVVVGDYNYWFDRSAILYALALETPWRVQLLVDEAHNLHARACAMYSTALGEAETLAVRAAVPAALRPRIDELLDQWQLLRETGPGAEAALPWQVLERLPTAWMRALQKFNAAAGEHLATLAAQPPGPLLAFYFLTLGFALLAEEFGEHSLCELAREAGATGRLAVPPAPAAGGGAVSDALWPAEDEALAEGQALARLGLRNIIPAPFLAERLRLADAVVMFSATLHPGDFHRDLLGLPEDTQRIDIPSPFRAEQLAVRILPISTRRQHRGASLDRLVHTLQEQYRRAPGNYLAFFSSFDYLEMALQRLRARSPGLPTWAQARQMEEAARRDFLDRFREDGAGIGFAVLGGAFAEGVDLPGRRLVGAFVATLGLPQFDQVNEAICARLEARFGKGRDYTYVYPGLQKVVQAAGRVIRSEDDTGTIVLLDARYRESRYRSLLPAWWQMPGASA